MVSLFDTTLIHIVIVSKKFLLLKVVIFLTTAFVFIFLHVACSSCRLSLFRIIALLNWQSSINE